MSNPVRRINDDVRSFVERANFNQRGTRLVPLGTAFEVARRSLVTTEGETFSVRRFRALSDVSDYVSLVQKNKWNSVEPRNSDLLPVAHPASTRKHRMSELQVRKSQARWYADDARITDSRVAPLLATAFTFPRGSAEHEYAIARLTAMGGQVPASALVAVAFGFNDGANRGFWRRQLRDRFGRFAEMGGGLRALVRRNGQLFRMNGSIVSTNADDEAFVIERPDNQLVKIPAEAGESVKAFIPDELTPDGFSREPVSAGSDEPVIDEADLRFVEAPDGFVKTEGRVDLEDDEAAPEVWLDDLENYEVAKVRDGEFIVSRNGDNEVEPFAVVDSWSEVQRVIREDEPRFEAGESPELEGDLREAGVAEVPSEDEAVEADLAEIERDQQNLADEEIAVGFGFDPEPGVAGEWDGGFDENDNRIIVQKIGDDNWNVALVRDDGDVRDVAQAGNAYEAFDQANEMRDRPQDFDAGMVFDYRQDEAERAEEAYMVDRGEYEPAGPDGEVESDDYTDDPADLATRFEPEELADALKESVEDGSGLARIEFEEGDEDVPSEAIYNALKEQGTDVDSFLDDIEAGRDAEISLPDEEPAAELPERRIGGRNQDAVALRELMGDNMPALFQGLSDRELQEVIDNDYDYRDYVSAPEGGGVPDGFYELEDGAVDPTVDIPGAPEGFQPFQFAVEYGPEELEEKFRGALSPDAERPGYAQFEVDGADGEPEAFDVPAEVIFDALELNGVDANEIAREVYDGGEPTPEELDEIAEGEGLPEAPSAEDIDTADEVFGGLDQEQKDALISNTKANGGYSVDVVSGDVPEGGFMVAAEADIPRGPEGFRKREEVVSFEEFEADPEKFVDAFVRRNIDKLEQENYYLGVWVDKDDEGNSWVYFDVSERLEDRDAAVEAARERGELAVFDVANGESIFVNDEEQEQEDDGEPEREESGERSGELPGDVGDGTSGVDGPGGADAAEEPEGESEEPVEDAEQPEMPPALPGTPEPDSSNRDVVLDPERDLAQQIQNAIDNGDVVVFRYNDKVRRFAPQSIWENPRNGNVNAYGADLSDGGAKKNFTISKIEQANIDELPEVGDDREVTPAPQAAPEPDVAQGDAVVPESVLPDGGGDAEAPLDPEEEEIRRFVAQREELLLRSEGRDRYNLPPIPEKYRRQVYIRLLAGLYADENGNPLAIGDKVVHRNPNKREKYGEGEVIDKKQGKVGGLQRAGVVYVDYAWVKFPGFEPVPLVSRFLRHTDNEVAAQRFAEEPRINWMNEEQMREALSERAKKPRREQPAEERAAEPEIQKAVTDIKRVVAEDVPEPDEPGGEVEQPDFEWNTQWMEENVPALPRRAGELTQGDFVSVDVSFDEPRRLYRVVSFEDESAFARRGFRRKFVLEDEDGQQKSFSAYDDFLIPETYRLADKAATDSSNRPPRAGDIVGSDFDDGADGPAILRGLQNIRDNYLPGLRNTRAPQAFRNAAKDMNDLVNRIEREIDRGDNQLLNALPPYAAREIAKTLRNFNDPDNKYNIARQAIPDLERLAANRSEFLNRREAEAAESLNAKHAEGLPEDLFDGVDVSPEGMEKLFQDLGRLEEFFPERDFAVDEEFAYDFRDVIGAEEKMRREYQSYGEAEEDRLRGAKEIASNLRGIGRKLKRLYSTRSPRLEFYRAAGAPLEEQADRLDAEVAERAEALKREYDERIAVRIPESEMPTVQDVNYDRVRNAVDLIRGKLPLGSADRYVRFRSSVLDVDWRHRTAAQSLDDFGKELERNQNNVLNAGLRDLNSAIDVLEDSDSGQVLREDLIDLKAALAGAQREAPVQPYAGPGLDELDPVEIQDQRISDGENAFDANSNVRQLFANEADSVDSVLNDFADEVQEFFRPDSGAKPLAQLSPRARVALRASASEKLKTSDNEEAGGLSRADYDNVFQLLRQLEAEDRAYLPEREGVGDNAEVLRNFADTSELFSYQEDEEILDENGNPTGWRVISNAGGGINMTKQLEFGATGERIWIKQELLSDTARAEYAVGALNRALGFPGAPKVEFANDYENNSKTLFITQAGQDARLNGDVDMANAAGLGLGGFRAIASDAIDKLSFLDTLRLGVIDALIDNTDRHSGNFMIGQADTLGIETDADARRIIPIDHGFAAVFGPTGAERSVARALKDRKKAGDHLRAEFIERIGVENYANAVRPILDDLENEINDRERYLGLYGEDLSSAMQTFRARIEEFRGILTEDNLEFLRSIV